MKIMIEGDRKLAIVSKSLVAGGLALSMGVANAAVLEEIVITAQKREQNLQDVGISVSAFSGDQIKALGITNTTEIIQQIPGLQLQTFYPGFVQFNLRGISQANFQDHLEAPVAVYMNDSYVASMNAISGQLFDVERVEVLRGPQGTLFGRNATGGLIHYVTKHASEEELNGYVEASISEYDKYSIEGAVGGAISDTVRGRFAVRWEEADGYVESQVGKRDLHGADGYSLRGSLQIDLGDAVVADFIVAYSEDDDVPTGSYVVQAAGMDANGMGLPVPGVPKADPFEDFSDGGFFERDSTSINLKFTWDVAENMEFVSISNFFDMEKIYVEDSDGTVSALTGAKFEFTTEADYSQWSQEFRLSGESERTRWQAGAYYLSIDADTPSRTDGNLLDFMGRYLITDAFSELESTNWSLFGQVEYDFSEELTLIVGYRWSQDDKDIDFHSTNDFRMPDGSDDGVGPIPFVTVDNDQGIRRDETGAVIAAVSGSFPGIDEIDYGDYAARIQLDWRPTDDSLYFISYNRGIKGGNWSPGNDVQFNNFKHDEEVLHSYEIGTKLTLWNGLARLNATLFYYDYEDYQQFSILNLTPQITNEDASNQGGEIELFLAPGEGWDIALGLSVIDSEVDGAPSAFNPNIGETELPNAPEFSFNALVRYEWQALGGTLAVQVDGVFTGEQYLEVNNNVLSQEDEYFVGNANLSYTSGDGSWKMTAWVKNFTDEEYRNYHLDLGSFNVVAPGAGFAQEVYGVPRWIGLTGSYHF